jgi:hypothetical protein
LGTLSLARVVCIGALLGAFAARAQTLSGGIHGNLLDALTHQPVADAVVIASSPALHGELTAVSDAKGAFTVAPLPPGVYRVDIHREGYRVVTQPDLLVPPEHTIKIHLQLLPDTLTDEAIELDPFDSDAIWVGRLALEKFIHRYEFDVLPYGRDARNSEAVIDAAIGTHRDPYGFSMSGSGSPEHSYRIDGQRVSDPALGTLGTNLLQDFVGEISIGTAGLPAESGHASGGAVEIVTESGGNEFHGSAFIHGSGFEASRRQPQGTGTIAAQQRQSYNLDFGATLGGPLINDKLWFFAGLAPQQIAVNADRIIQAQIDDGNGHPQLDGNGAPITFEVARQTYRTTTTALQFIGKLTWSINENHNFALEAFGDPASTRGAQAIGAANEGSSLYDSRQGAIDAGLIYSGRFFSKQMRVVAKFGIHHQFGSAASPSVSVNSLAGLGAARRLDSPSITWNTTTNLLAFNNGGVFGDGTAPSSQNAAPTVAGCGIHSDGFNPCPVSNYRTGGLGLVPSRTANRLQTGLNLQNFVDRFFGHHSISSGVELSKAFYEVAETFTGGEAFNARFSGSNLADYQGVGGFGRPDPAAPGMPVLMSGAVNANGASILSLASSTVRSDSQNLSAAGFLEDYWNILDSDFTINAGLRIEHQKLSTDDNTAPVLALTNAMPRVSLRYALPAQGFEIVGAYGQYYEEVPLDLAARVLSIPTQVTYSTSASNCTDPKDPRSCRLLVGGQPSGKTYLFTGGTSDRVDPNLKGQYTNQLAFNAQYETTTFTGVALRYVRSWLGRAIEDMSANDGNSYFLSNPGEPCSAASMSAGACGQYGVTGLGQVVAVPAPRRVYDGVTLAFTHTFFFGWELDASYTHSALRGNYPGLFNATTGLHPNSLSEYDLLSLLPSRDGPLPGDDPNSFKFDGAYTKELNSRMRFNLGGTLRIDEGGPLNYLGSHPLYGPGEAFILPRGSDGRLPWIWQINLRVSFEYALRKDCWLAASIDIFNLTDNRAATSVDENYTFDRVQPIVNGQPKDLAYLTNTSGAPVALNPTFNQATGYQLPFTFRLGAKLSF